MKAKDFNIVDKSGGRLQEMIDFAVKTNQTESLADVLKRLQRHSNDSQTVTVHSDYAPYSLLFVVSEINTSRVGLVGGVIYHGKHDGFGSGAGPAFAVTLEQTQGWAIHT